MGVTDDHGVDPRQLLAVPHKGGGGVMKPGGEEKVAGRESASLEESSSTCSTVQGGPRYLLGPMNCTGEALWLKMGSVRTFSPSISTSTVA